MADSLRSLQEGFAAHIRNPQQNPAPRDVEDRRMAIYRDLFFRNLSNFIAKSFPVLRRLHSDTAWSAMIRDFYTVHECHTPMFPEIPREFLQYLQDRRATHPEDMPFLLELAHYEWVEIALDLDERELDDVPADQNGDLLQSIPVLSPLAWPLAYRYPVHQIRPDFQPTEPPQQPTHLLVYRNRNDRVKFMQLNGVTARMIELMKENQGLSGLNILNTVAQELSHPQPETVIEAGTGVLRDLASRDVILGTRQS